MEPDGGAGHHRATSAAKKRAAFVHAVTFHVSRSAVLAPSDCVLAWGISEIPLTTKHPTTLPAAIASSIAAATPAASISTASSLGHVARTLANTGSVGSSTILSP